VAWPTGAGEAVGCAPRRDTVEFTGLPEMRAARLDAHLLPTRAVPLDPFSTHPASPDCG